MPKHLGKHQLPFFRTMFAALAIGLVLCSQFAEGAGAAAAPTAACTAGEADCSTAARPQATSPEQQLADVFAPIVMLKQQKEPCDTDGEPYVPAPIETVLDDPNVALREHTGRTSSELIKMAPTTADIANLGPDYEIDFPGNPRRGGCGYELWARGRMATLGAVPTTYANVVVSPTRHQVAVQYWFWYVFNDFNNTHEGDWEMVQIIFDADSVEQALTSVPVATGYSQHSGGERAAWGDPKLQKEGLRPIVYAAAGSHASQYESGVYLGWGEDGSGFGCDITTGPSVRIEPKVVLLPGTVTDASSPLAWTSFQGLWGERQRAFYSGITGPTDRVRWGDPFTWQDGIRSTTLNVTGARSEFGPGFVNLFCTTTRIMSLTLTRFAVYPWAIIAAIAAIIFAVVLLIRLAGGIVRDAVGVYIRNWRLFAILGIFIIPIGFGANIAQNFVSTHPPGKAVMDTMNVSPTARFAFAITVGGFQQLLSLIVIGPLVIEAVAEIMAGRTPTFPKIWRRLMQHLRALISGLLRAFAVIFVLTISIVGIPWAIQRTVRWWFVSQSVMIDNVEGKDACNASARIVNGHWWETGATVLLLAILGSAAGPVLGICFLILASPSIRYVTALSSFIYAILMPLAVIGSTLLYKKLKEQPATPSDAPAAITPADAAPAPAT